MSADVVVYGLCPVNNLIRKFIIECKSSSSFWLEQPMSHIFHGILTFLSKVNYIILFVFEQI